MKKLFSIFCCLLLSASMVTQAQLQLGNLVNRSSEKVGVLDQENESQITGRRNAPQASDISFHCDYADILQHQTSTTAFYKDKGNYNIGDGNNVAIAARNANGAAMQLWFTRNNDTNYGVYDGGECSNITGPYPGTYTLYLANSVYADYGIWCQPTGNALACYREAGGNTTPNYSFIQYGGQKIKLRGKLNTGGQVVVSENNVGGLFIETVNVQDYDRTRNIYFTFGNRSENTINLGTGSMTLNSSLTMTATSGNNSAKIKINSASIGSFNQSSFDMGNTSFTYNGSAVTIGKISATVSQSGSTYTIVATIRDNQENVYFVTMSAVAGGTEYTISTAVSPSNTYGTVSGAGSYTENSVITLTATSANEHLYIFDHWLKDGNNYAGGATITPTVTANATYTAVFRNAAEGTITGVANYGTISGTGHYTGGSAVTLTVTPNSGYKFAQWSDGNEDNPRTVYVDGDATYTAQFTDLNQPLLASFSWETDNISIETYGDGDGLCNSIYSPASKQFHLLYAKANNRSTKNYLNLSIQSSQTYMWGDVSFFKPGSYPVVSSGYTTGFCGDNGPYWYWTLDQTDVCVAYGYDSYNLGLNTLGSYLCDKSGNADDDSDQSNYISIEEGITCIIEVGANGNPYVRLVRNTDQQCLVSVGAQATTHTVTINTPTNGTITVKDGETTINNGDQVEDGTVLTVTTTPATGYHFDSWTNNGAASVTVNSDVTIGATFAPNTYNVSFTAGGGSGTMTDQVFTYGEAQNLKANTFTAPTATATYNYNGATGGNSPASATVTATADGWTEGNNYYEEGAEVNNLTTTNGATVALTAFWGWTEEITLPTPTKTGYEFHQWSFNMGGMDLMEDAGAEIPIEEDVTMTAQWNIVTYNLTYEGLEGATNTNPTSYNVESETITLADPGARDGYAFTGWTINGTPVTEITHGSTGDKTITATWNAKLSSITLEDNRENSFYNTFKTTYDRAKGVVVTYKRQFTKGRWSTLCLPFNVNKNLVGKLFGSHIYEFKYAEGNANEGSGVNLYFSIAKSIEAGKGYIVNAGETLSGPFIFPGVTMDLSADKGDELNSVKAYDKLTNGCSTKDSDIELVGTLRKGTLKGTTDGNTYMGLKDNKIYYPNITTGSTILAYRGIFRSKTGTLNAERIRIIVDGEEKAELEVINGGLQDVQETKKFIENGVLYIERNGVIYDATGRKVE